MPQMALSCMCHLSNADALCYEYKERESGRARERGIEVLPNTDRLENLKRKTGRKNILNALRWPPRLVARHLQVGQSPSLKLASNLLSRSVGPWEYYEWQAVCLGLHMPHLHSSLPSPFLSLYPPLRPPPQYTNTHTHLPLGFFLTALWQFPLLALKRFEIAFGPEALAISN